MYTYWENFHDGWMKFFNQFQFMIETANRVECFSFAFCVWKKILFGVSIGKTCQKK